uniref:dTMP kinase n=1 Tax=uncultured Acinetobacter sp. TaxID=165433 RepID=UPI0026034ECB|nr:dTMP kinase [uncultured Acinetobacter sp.]
MFISFEGTEGVGKSTLIASLNKALSGEYDVVITREPGGTPLAEQIRELLLTPKQELMNSATELLLIYAARVQHVDQVILPALAQNKVVLCDRFVDASVAYQHGGRGMDKSQINLLTNTFVAKMPDLTFWLDLPVEQGMQRAKNRGALDRFEQEKTEFFKSIQASYRQLAEQNPQRIIRLDASQSAEQLFEEAISIIQEKMKA